MTSVICDDKIGEHCVNEIGQAQNGMTLMTSSDMDLEQLLLYEFTDEN